MSHLNRLASLIVFGLAGSVSAFNFAPDFSVTGGNPNGAWTYGYATSLGSPLNVFTTTSSTAQFESWYTPGLSGDNTPTVFRNVWHLPLYGVNPGNVALHGGPAAQLAVARLTVTAASTYVVEGTFGAGDIGVVDLYVRVHGVSHFTALSASGDAGFNFSVALASGDTIDFVVGTANDFRFDSTPLSATVTAVPVPEPATAAIVAGALLGAVRRRRHLVHAQSSNPLPRLP